MIDQVIKFELTGETKTATDGVTLYRIRATEDIPMAAVMRGDLGGWVESTQLANGSARISGNAWVYGGAFISGNARIYGDARVSGNARISGDARVAASEDYLTLGPIGPGGVTATLHRTETGHGQNGGCWAGAIGALTEGAEKRATFTLGTELQKEVWAAQYAALEALGNAVIKQWSADK